MYFPRPTTLIGAAHRCKQAVSAQPSTLLDMRQVIRPGKKPFLVWHTKVMSVAPLKPQIGDHFVAIRYHFTPLRLSVTRKTKGAVRLDVDTQGSFSGYKPRLRQYSRRSTSFMDNVSFTAATLSRECCKHAWSTAVPPQPRHQFLSRASKRDKQSKVGTHLTRLPSHCS